MAVAAGDGVVVAADGAADGLVAVAADGYDEEDDDGDCDSGSGDDGYCHYCLSLSLPVVLPLQSSLPS